MISHFLNVEYFLSRFMWDYLSHFIKAILLNLFNLLNLEVLLITNFDLIRISSIYVHMFYLSVAKILLGLPLSILINFLHLNIIFHGVKVLLSFAKK